MQTYTINVIGSQPANLTANLALLNNDSELPIVKSSVIRLDETDNKIKLASTSYVNGSETTTESTINLSSEQFKVVADTLMLAKNYLEVSAAEALLNQKQDKLISGTNLMTINGVSLLGEGNMVLATVQPNAGSHNSIYRGKFLGNSVTDAQYQALKDGTFTDLFIGDYWTIGGVNYRIASFDYFMNCGNAATTKHHAVIVPDTCLYNHVMNDTNTTDGGYVGSKMYKEGLESAKTTIKAAFSGHVLSHRIYLTNAVANGKPSAGAWCDSEVDLMCEEMVYGGGIFRPTSDGSTVPANYRVEESQLPLFAHEPSRICNRNNWWLRDVITAARFAIVTDGGSAACGDAVYSRGVRPAFCIS